MSDIRFQLANEQVGLLVLDTEDPRGSESLEQTIKRSDENDGVIHEISLSLDWAKQAKSFIQQCYEEAGGIEAVVIVNLFERDVNARTWESYYTGRLDMIKYKINEVIVTVPIQQVSLQKKILNLSEGDLDLETDESQSGAALPNTQVIDLEYHAKKILKSYLAQPSSDAEVQGLDVFQFVLGACGGDCTYSKNQDLYLQIGFEDKKLDELDDSFTYPFGWSTESRFENLRAQEAGIADIDIKFRLKHKIEVSQTGGGGDVDIIGPCSSSGLLAEHSFKAFFEHRDSNDNVKTLVEFGDWVSMNGCGDGVGTDPSTLEGDFEEFQYTATGVEIELGDKLYAYVKININGEYDRPVGISDINLVHSFWVTPDIENTYFSVQTATEFPATSHKTILIHEVLEKMTQYYSDQTSSFKSDFFGRTELGYAEDGAGAFMGITSGRVLRNLDNQTIFANLDDAMKSLNMLWCLGMGFETIDGTMKLVVEQKSHFYNPDTIVLELGQVSDLDKEVAEKYYYSQLEFSYPKLDAGQINGIDEFNTVRKYTAPLTQAKQKLPLKSIWKASGFEIESQRRLQSSSKDSRNDEAIFMVMLRRSLESLSGWETDRNQDFDSVTGLYDPDSAYNLKISPARAALNWKPWLAGPLFKNADSNKAYKFASGEGNYTMETQLMTEDAPVAENAPIETADTVAQWKPEIYNFTAPLSGNQFRILRESPYGVITFKDELNDTKEGFILEVKHKPADRLGKFRLLRVNRITTSQ